MTVLTTVTWLLIVGFVVGSVAAYAFGLLALATVCDAAEWVGEALNDLCERYQHWWHATGVDRLARHQRRQEHTR